MAFDSAQQLATPHWMGAVRHPQKVASVFDVNFGPSLKKVPEAVALQFPATNFKRKKL